jgi:hypothetical protein
MTCRRRPFKGATVADAVTNSVLSDWPLPLGSRVQAESAEVIGRAKRAVAKWTRDHAEYPNLRALVSPLIDLTKVEEATTDAHLTPAAHLWSLVAFYAMAGRLRFGGKGADTPAAAASMTPVDLQRIVDGCKRAGPTARTGTGSLRARTGGPGSVPHAGPPRQSRLTVAPPRAGLP